MVCLVVLFGGVLLCSIRYFGRGTEVLFVVWGGKSIGLRFNVFVVNWFLRDFFFLDFGFFFE